MNKKLLWAIIACVFGFFFFLGVNQYLGGFVIAIGIFLASLYADEKKEMKNNQSIHIK